MSPETLELITTAKLELHPGGGYGYLFFDVQSAGGRWIGHDGGSEGVNAECRMYPDRGWVVIVLANHEGAADELAGYVHDLVTR